MDYKINFENHIDQACIKTREKIKALETIAPFLNKEKKKTTDEHIFQISV